MSTGQVSGEGAVVPAGGAAAASSSTGSPVDDVANQALAENLAKSPVYRLYPDVLRLILRELPTETLRQLGQVSKLFRGVILGTPELYARRQLDIYASRARDFADKVGDISVLLELASIQRDETCVILARRAFEAIRGEGPSSGTKKLYSWYEKLGMNRRIKQLELNLVVGSERLNKIQNVYDLCQGVFSSLIRNPRQLRFHYQKMCAAHAEGLLAFKLDRIKAKSFTNRPKAMKMALLIGDSQKRDEALFEIVKVKIDQPLERALKEAELITDPYFKVKALAELAKLYKSKETLKKAKDLLATTDQPQVTYQESIALVEIHTAELIINYPSVSKKYGGVYIHEPDFVTSAVNELRDRNVFDVNNHLEGLAVTLSNPGSNNWLVGIYKTQDEVAAAAQKMSEFINVFARLKDNIFNNNREKIIDNIKEIYQLFSKHDALIMELADFNKFHSDLKETLYGVVYRLTEIYSWTHNPEDLAFARALVSIEPDSKKKANLSLFLAYTSLQHEELKDNQDVKLVEAMISDLTTEEKAAVFIRLVTLIADYIPAHLRVRH